MNAPYAAGYFGKMPAKGDFVSRGLPPWFVDPWDGWLQSAMASSKALLGQEWLGCYMSAPLWRFLLAPGVISPRAAAGVLCPSVDRVGRHFPLTIACLLGEPALDLAASLLKLESWFVAVEDAVLSALNPSLDVEQFGRGVEALALSPADLVPAPGDAAAWRGARSGAALLHTHTALGEGPLLESTLKQLGAQSGAAALWMACGSDVMPDCALATSGLPAGEHFSGMLDGQWQRHGWSDASQIAGGLARQASG